MAKLILRNGIIVTGSFTQIISQSKRNALKRFVQLINMYWKIALNKKALALAVGNRENWPGRYL